MACGSCGNKANAAYVENVINTESKTTTKEPESFAEVILTGNLLQIIDTLDINNVEKIIKLEVNKYLVVYAW